MDCIFCKIVKGEIDSAKIWEDDDILVFLDINPVTKGHCLVVSKKHFENIFDIDEEILKKIIIVSKSVSLKIKNSLGADGIRFSQSNGKIAGQVIFHFHLHIIPRYQDDGLLMNNWGNESPPKANIEDLKSLAEKINSV